MRSCSRHAARLSPHPAWRRRPPQYQRADDSSRTSTIESGFRRDRLAASRPSAARIATVHSGCPGSCGACLCTQTVKPLVAAAWNDRLPRQILGGNRLVARLGVPEDRHDPQRVRSL